MNKADQDLKYLIVELLQSPFSTYEQAKRESEKCDQLLGFECQKVEEEIYQLQNPEEFSTTQQFWYGLDIQSLQTPYAEIHEMVQLVKPSANDLWVDLGAAYGRIGIYMGFVDPNIRFKGYEFVRGRVIEGQRILDQWKISSSQLIQSDIADEEFIVEEAQVYFIYDFGSKRDVYRVLEKLKKKSGKYPFQVIARGRGVRHWICDDHPWLTLKVTAKSENWSLFS